MVQKENECARTLERKAAMGHAVYLRQKFKKVDSPCSAHRAETKKDATHSKMKISKHHR
jgi:hypothetical protein